MVEQYYNQIIEHQDIRENLSQLRKAVKDPTERERCRSLFGEDGTVLVALLSADDPKTRKNTALLLGDLGLQKALDSLFCAYQKETTRFVKSSYLAAIAKLDATSLLPALKEILELLLAMEPKEDEVKHVKEEIKELRKIILGCEGIPKHTFTGAKEPQEVLLSVRKELRNVTAEEVAAVCGDQVTETKLHPLGVLVHTEDVAALARLRTFRELLFVLSERHLSADPVKAAEELCERGLCERLCAMHKEAAPFYFRVDVRGLAPEKKMAFLRKFSAALEQVSNQTLINAPGDYEMEIRLVASKDGGYLPLLWIGTIPMRRFSYRKGVTANSMYPSLAAALVRLAAPYLAEHAQILDPFCGVGTLLIERNRFCPAREIYGIDRFGEAVAKARENAAAAGASINFINRDYFDFRHEYLFDEIITDFPLRGKMTREELDRFYASFFRESAEILKRGATLILYSNEEGVLKKQLRLHPDFSLVSSSCIQKTAGFYLYVIRYQ
jgi:predicted RNA methylase